MYEKLCNKVAFREEGEAFLYSGIETGIPLSREMLETSSLREDILEENFVYGTFDDDLERLVPTSTVDATGTTPTQRLKTRHSYSSWFDYLDMDEVRHKVLAFGGEKEVCLASGDQND
ncbi:hypothetical protein F1880_004607 [Penicillium rolfsii]|nr:hypothetical protein F1880_004607 [Penicillium rolfsii]